MLNSGLDSNHISAINSVFAKFEQVEKVILYGSRALGTYNERSDIDLVAVGSNIDRFIIIKIKHELEELNIPYFIDLQDYNAINNANLIEHIQRVGKIFYRRKEKT